MIAFILLSILILALAVISFMPGGEWLYTSLPMVCLWGATGVCGIYYMVRSRMWHRRPVLWLHLALLVILAGAAVTHFTGVSRTLELRVGESGAAGPLEVRLESFAIDYYPGTSAPRDFVSTIIVDGDSHRVSVNHVADIRGWRFFQTAAHSDLGGSTLTVTHDPLGTNITYFGYMLLFVSMVWCVVAGRVRACCCGCGGMLLLLLLPADAAAAPRTVSPQVADSLGNLFVSHNGRIAPLSTLASDFTRRLTGAASYRGLSPVQVMAGWLFFYDDWKSEPCIRIKDRGTLAEMGAQERVALTDFFTPAGYRFEDDRHTEANEKFSIASSSAAGSLWRLFPYHAPERPVEWLSPVDHMPPAMDTSDWHITRHSLNYLAGLIAEGATDADVCDAIAKIARWQRLKAGEWLPTPRQVRCERFYLWGAGTPVPAIAMIVCGVALIFVRRRRPALIVAIIALGWTAALVGASWVASGHIPLSDGRETMQFMALCSLVVTLLMARRAPQWLAPGIIIAALALAVAYMGQRSPQVTTLMPVLNSPLLSLHVLTVMLAYTLLALMALSGAMWLCGRRDMLATARSMLRPAVFLLATGIFIGSVWANVSWGRYWGWDPKEVWALITMLVYCFPLHRSTFPLLGRDRPFAIFCTAAFITVVMTYFGVNFLLGGLHSYA